MNFWDRMQKPILCLAPMADVTDAAFRYLIAKYSKLSEGTFDSYVTWTEFVSADGLVLAPEEGRKKLLKNFEYSEIERPIVAQIFGAKPENICKAASTVAELGFDGLDINMGCPDRSVERQGAGAALMKDHKLAREIIAAAKEGAGLVPVSVKTRLGYNKDELDPPVGGWLSELLAEKPAAITLHARTRKEMSKTPARWERVQRAVEIRDAAGSKTLLIGNGDVKDTSDALQKCAETGADGAMLGRAVFGKPWIFSNSLEWLNNDKILEIMEEHIKLFDEKHDGMSFPVMKKHFKSYLSQIPGSKNLLRGLVEAKDAEEAFGMLYYFYAHGAL